MSRKMILIAVLTLVAGAGAVRAQAPGQPAAPPAPPLPYGLSIDVADAKKAAAAAVAQVAKVGSAPDAIAIVDTGGHLVYFERMDNASVGAVRASIKLARSAVLYRHPTKVFEDILAGGRTAIMALPGATPLEGGVPLIAGGKIVGAIGAGGGTGQQDGQVAGAGATAVK